MKIINKSDNIGNININIIIEVNRINEIGGRQISNPPENQEVSAICYGQIKIENENETNVYIVMNLNCYQIHKIIITNQRLN